MRTSRQQPRPAIDWAEVRSRMNAAIVQTEALLTPAAAGDSKDGWHTGGSGISTDMHAATAISFTLSGREFAVEIPFVCEIVSKIRTTPLPGMRSYVKGIHDLRGQLLPVFDLRSLLGLPDGEVDNSDWALVIGDSQPEFLILSEAVPEVIRLPLAEIRRSIAAANTLQAGTGAVVEPNVQFLDGRLLLSDPRLFLEHGNAGDVDAEEKETVP